MARQIDGHLLELVAEHIEKLIRERNNNMTARDSQFFLGKVGSYFINGLRVDVRIEDVKLSYGRTCFQITPVAGSGLIWVDTQSVLLDAGLPGGGVRSLNERLEA